MAMNQEIKDETIDGRRVVTVQYVGPSGQLPQLPALAEVDDETEIIVNARFEWQVK